jgi:dipeptidyl aminopeptidase/acylaminoacyl peptidase
MTMLAKGLSRFCALSAALILLVSITSAEATEPTAGQRPVTLDDIGKIKWPNEPRPSPDGKQIAYEVDGQVYVVATAGGEPRAVTSAGSSASSPVWSRDGRWLYFLRTPTLFDGGREGWNVPVLNAELFYQSLKKRGIETQLVVYPGTHHGDWSDEFQRDLLVRMHQWFDKHLGISRPSTAGP